MTCPYCDFNFTTATLTDNFHAGRLDCNDCGRMIKWLSPKEADELCLDLHLVSDTGSEVFWNDFLSMLPSTECILLSELTLRVGLFKDNLIIVLKLSQEDDRFKEISCAIPCLDRTLSVLFDRKITVEISSLEEWRTARIRTTKHFEATLKENAIPIDIIFRYYYCQSIDNRIIGSFQWMRSQVDDLILLSKQKGYKPGWVLNVLSTRYNLSLDAFDYLAKCFDYHPDWAVKNYQKYHYGYPNRVKV